MKNIGKKIPLIFKILICFIIACLFIVGLSHYIFPLFMAGDMLSIACLFMGVIIGSCSYIIAILWDNRDY